MERDCHSHRVTEEAAARSEAVPGHRAPALPTAARQLGLRGRAHGATAQAGFLSQLLSQQQPRCVFPGCNPLLAAAQTPALGLIAPRHRCEPCPEVAQEHPEEGEPRRVCLSFPRLPHRQGTAALVTTLVKHLSSASAWLELESPEVLSRQGPRPRLPKIPPLLLA